MSNCIDKIFWLFKCVPWHMKYMYTELCKPSIGFASHHLRLEEGDTKKVCLRACSCEITKDLTVEIKVFRQDSGNGRIQCVVYQKLIFLFCI